MNILTKLCAIAAAIAIGSLCVPAEAATPASGTLSKTKKALTWTGTFTASDPSPIEGCVGGTDSPICDHFALKINLGEGAKIKVSLPPQTATDLDMYIYGPTGILVGFSGNLPGMGEAVEFTHRARYRNKPYIVQVKPYLVVPGTSYKATAKVLVLGAK